jgi:hypothetical protein
MAAITSLRNDTGSAENADDKAAEPSAKTKLEAERNTGRN